jgi:xanthine dehydrogenase accessory factor
VTDAEILEQAAAWLDEGQGVALATVTRTWGSAPRPVGSQLAVSGRGELAGSVSGGCVEAAVVEASQEVIRSGSPRRLSFGVTHERAWEVGLPCGGTIDVAVVRVEGRAALAPLLADLAGRRLAVAVLDLASGAQRLLHPEAAAAPPDPRLPEAASAPQDPLLPAARAAARRGRSGPATEPAGDLFLRIYAPPTRLVLVGAVHIAQALAPMARLAGFHAVVIDPRTAFASAARFPGTELVVAWPEAALADLEVDRHTAVVALSHDPKLDDPALAAALRGGAFYVGALGSRRSHAARCARLLALGLSQVEVARVHGPVGLDVGAEGPGEIAASILAELILSARRR